MVRRRRYLANASNRGRLLGVWLEWKRSVDCLARGAKTLKEPLTIVLPIHNHERRLRSLVLQILELAHSIEATIEIVVVDDGSTDETYETACELARTYPQLKVFRQPIRRGLKAALETVGHRLSADAVVVHDGVSSIEVAQLKSLLQSTPGQQGAARRAGLRESAEYDSAGSRRFAAVRTLHTAMEQAHSSVSGFQWVRLMKPVVPRRRSNATPPLLASVLIPPSMPPSAMAPEL